MSTQVPKDDPSVSIPLRQLDPSPHPAESAASHDNKPTPPTSKTTSPSPPPRNPEYRHNDSLVNIPRRRNPCKDWWTWELLGITTSGFSLAAMVAVLVYFDGETKPRKQHRGVDVTINSILSWTATIAKSAMLIPISDGLSQMKWIWFTEKERDLADMEYFEEASRGPWGSMHLIFRLRARHLGVLGAVVTLLALAFDPMVQQVVRYRPRTVMFHNTSAIVSSSEYYGGYYSEIEPTFVTSYRSAPLPIKAATYSGLFTDHPVTNPYFVCPSDTCDWPHYSSLSVCSTCHDVTSQLRLNCAADSCNAELPSGTLLNGSSRAVMSTDASAKAVYFKNASSIVHVLGLFQNIAAFGQSDVGRLSHLEAAECMLYICVRKYSSTVKGGKYNEMILNTWPDLKSTTNATAPENNSTEYFYTISGRKYGMASGTFNDVKQYLSTLLHGTVVIKSGDTEPTFYNSDVLQPIWDGKSFSEPVSRVAATLTKVVRDGNNTGDTPSGSPPGTAGMPEVYIEVRWTWLVIPIALFFATAVQLALTIFRTRRSGAGIWRSSALALAFHGLDRDVDEVATARLKGNPASSENEETLLKAAKGIKVRMVRLEDGTTRLISSHEAGERLLGRQAG